MEVNQKHAEEYVDQILSQIDINQHSPTVPNKLDLSKSNISGSPMNSRFVDEEIADSIAQSASAYQSGDTETMMN